MPLSGRTDVGSRDRAAGSASSQVVNMSEIMKDKATHLAKNRGSVSSLGSHEIRVKDFFGRYKDSVSTVSYLDEHGHHEDSLRPAIQLENTYQLGPTKYFPITAVNNILKDVVVSYLQEEQYEAELCRQMTKTISEVIKARIKDLMVPRFKIIVIIYIGQLGKQSMQIGSRCLWDTTSDTFSSYSFKNRSLFALANVYALYSE
uniref:Dynein light chain Tctex-type family member 5 n=1 Tax=Laticauda laticaudata TaxID=8630 RepID=A0A8C5WZD9_LATLA